MDPIAKLYKAKILTEATNDDINRVAKANPDVSRETIQHYADNADPKPGKGSRYLDWIVKGHANGSHSEEDAYRVKDALNNFEKHKPKLEKKDINQYKHVSELEDAVAPHLGTVSKTAANKESTFWENPEHHEKIYDNGKGLKVYHTKTKEASQAIYGGGHSAGGCHSSWCTAARSEHNRFDYYSKKGENPLYQIHTPDGKVYQDEFSGDYSGGLRDAADHSVKRKDLVKEHPDLTKVPAFQGKDLSYTGPGPKLDEALHKEAKNGNYGKVLAHPHAKTEHLDSAIEHSSGYDQEVIPKVLAHPKAEASTISKAIDYTTNASYDTHDTILNHPKFNDSHIHQILDKGQSYTSQMNRLFDSGKLTRSHVDKMLSGDNQEMRHLALRHPLATDADRLKSVENHPEDTASAIRHMADPKNIHSVLSAATSKGKYASDIVSNPNSSAESIRDAYKAPGVANYAKIGLVTHKNASEDVVTEHVMSGKHHEELLDTNKLNSSHVEHIFNSNKNHAIKQAAIMHPNATQSMIDSVKQTPSFHGALSVSTATDGDTLHELSRSKYSWVRNNVASNPSTKKETLQDLSSDSDADVAKAATKSLKKKK